MPPLRARVVHFDDEVEQQARSPVERDEAGDRAHVHADVSIEVDDVDDVYARALAAGAETVYPITDEDWGVRRFFARDPNGAIINVTQHR